jgi:cytoskeletal protein CcmA (bactofilin family)
MWKRQEEQPSKPANNTPNNFPNRQTEEGFSTMPPAMPEPKSNEYQPDTFQRSGSSKAHIGRSVQIKGELSGSEDLHIDGTVEGSIELRDHHLTIGATGKVNANVNAKKVVILGSIKGNIRATDGVEIKKTGSLIGDLIVAGVSIEEGAYFKGSIDIQRTGQSESKPKDQPKVEPKKMEPVPVAAQPQPVGAGANSKPLR